MLRRNKKAVTASTAVWWRYLIRDTELGVSPGGNLDCVRLTDLR